MSITCPLRQPRFGNVLLNFTSEPRRREHLTELAARVTRSDDTSWVAESFEDAAAWLLCAAHSHASNSRLPGLDLPEFSYHLLGFRGQAAKYETLSPSLYRIEGLDEQHWTRVGSIFASLVTLWTDTYCQRAPDRYDYRMEPDACLAMGQHYGIKTTYLDWSFDPLNALFFSIDGLKAGDQARVIMNHFAGIDDPASSYKILLPHPCLERPWRQCGFFDHCLNPREIDDVTLRIVGSDFLRAKLAPPGSHWNIVFPVGEIAVAWAEGNRAAIYEDEFCFELLAEFCGKVAEEDDSPFFLYKLMDHLVETCERLGCDLPYPFRAARNVALPIEVKHGYVLAYLDAACGAYHPSRGVSYFMPALRAVHVGTPWGLMEEAARKAASVQDSRAQPIGSIKWDYDLRMPNGINPRTAEHLYHPISGACASARSS